jgi:hypothetical protein
MQSSSRLRTRNFMYSTLKEEPRWHAALAVVAILALYATLPPRIIVGPFWLLPLLVLGILVPLLILAPHRHRENERARFASIAHIAILSVFNVATIALFLVQLLTTHHHRIFTGEQLLVAAVQIWLTNMLVYALWFWEIDGGGPSARCHQSFVDNPELGDFMFSQSLLDPELRAKLNWRPRFLDYLFLAFTNATAFSPTDTFPLTSLGKVLMMAEALTSLVTIAIVAGRAINILGS